MLRLRRVAKWRSLPATPSQLSVIRKRWGKRQELGMAFGGDPEDKADTRLAAMTKGEAANIITRLKHGALVS
jgi:ATP-dependent helicase IRC3